jgi:hypothetical protein
MSKLIFEYNRIRCYARVAESGRIVFSPSSSRYANALMPCSGGHASIWFEDMEEAKKLLPEYEVEEEELPGAYRTYIKKVGAGFKKRHLSSLRGKYQQTSVLLTGYQLVDLYRAWRRFRAAKALQKAEAERHPLDAKAAGRIVETSYRIITPKGGHLHQHVQEVADVLKTGQPVLLGRHAIEALEEGSPSFRFYLAPRGATRSVDFRRAGAAAKTFSGLNKRIEIDYEQVARNFLRAVAQDADYINEVA